jgi:hypothetical protein
MGMAKYGNPQKLQLHRLDNIYILRFSDPDEVEGIRWSSERFWCRIRQEECFIRRYMVDHEEIDIDDQEYY